MDEALDRCWDVILETQNIANFLDAHMDTYFDGKSKPNKARWHEETRRKLDLMVDRAELARSLYLKTLESGHPDDSS